MSIIYFIYEMRANVLTTNEIFHIFVNAFRFNFWWANDQNEQRFNYDAIVFRMTLEWKRQPGKHFCDEIFRQLYEKFTDFIDSVSIFL